MNLGGLWVFHAHERNGKEQEISFALVAPSIEAATQRARVILRKTHPDADLLIISATAVPSGVWVPEPADFEQNAPEAVNPGNVLTGKFS